MLRYVPEPELVGLANKEALRKWRAKGVIADALVPLLMKRLDEWPRGPFVQEARDVLRDVCAALDVVKAALARLDAAAGPSVAPASTTAPASNESVTPEKKTGAVGTSDPKGQETGRPRVRAPIARITRAKRSAAADSGAADRRRVDSRQPRQ